jgi:hypothetical protein
MILLSGKLVRIGPTEVSVSDPEALKVIYCAGSKFSKTKYCFCQSTRQTQILTMHRWYPIWNFGGRSGKWDIFADPTHDGHAANKRMVSSSYSLNAVTELDLFVQRPTDRLLQRMGEFADNGKPMNLSLWLQWYAFDVIGEVSFSKQFGFLDQGKDVDNTLKNIEDSLWSGIVMAELPELDDLRNSALFQLLPFVGNYKTNMNMLAKVSDASQRYEVQLTVWQKAQSVLAERGHNTVVDRRDLLSRFFMIQKENPKRFDDSDVLMLTMLNIFAGSDTTSIALRAILYYLIQNERSHKILMAELDEAYRTGQLSEKSTFAEAQKLPYLQACIKEAMRLHPSLGTQHVRWVPEGGATIAGTYLPAKVRHILDSPLIYSRLFRQQSASMPGSCTGRPPCSVKTLRSINPSDGLRVIRA